VYTYIIAFSSDVRTKVVISNALGLPLDAARHEIEMPANCNTHIYQISTKSCNIWL